MPIAYRGALLLLFVSGCSGGHAGVSKDAGSAGGAGGATSGGAGGGAGGVGGAGGAGGAAVDAATGGAGGGAGGGVIDGSSEAVQVSDGGFDAACGVTTLALQGARVDLLLVLDRSGSMSNDFADNLCGGAIVCDASNPSKWTAMTAALTTVVTDTQALVNWGFKSFASNNTCAVNAGVAIPVGPDNATPVLNALMAIAPGGLTPTALAEQGGAAYLAAVADANPRYILLATDGEPNCAVAGQNMPDDPRAIQAVTDAFAAGVSTFVVGVGNLASAEATLNAMAVAGGTAQAADTFGRRYLPADSPDQLAQSLTLITGSIVSCSFALPASPAAPDSVVVLGDGNPIARDASNGWSYGAGGTSVVLNGAACDAFKAGGVHTVQPILGCSNAD